MFVLSPIATLMAEVTVGGVNDVFVDECRDGVAPKALLKPDLADVVIKRP